MDVKTNLKVNSLKVDSISILSANIGELSVGGEAMASQQYVLDVVQLASRYGHKTLGDGDLSASAFSINRTPDLSAGQSLSVTAPMPVSGAVIDWQILADLTNLSSSEDEASIVLVPPLGVEFNWQYIDGNTEIENGKRYLTIYQAMPARTGSKYSVITTTRELKDA